MTSTIKNFPTPESDKHGFSVLWHSKYRFDVAYYGEKETKPSADAFLVAMDDLFRWIDKKAREN